MKLLATTAAVSVLAFAAQANTINGCEVELIEGSNAYQFVDPTCPPFNGGGSSQAGHDENAANAEMVEDQVSEARQAFFDDIEEHLQANRN